MMYLQAIHKNDMRSALDKQYNEDSEFVKTILEEMESALRTSRELKEFGIYTEENEDATNSIIVDGVRKIGQRILDMIQRMQQFISDTVTKIKAGIWEAKNEEQKLREIARRCPDKIDDIRVMVSRDELNFVSYKDLLDFYENSEKIIDDIKKSRIDPKTARGRWEALKRKMENSDAIIKTTSTALGIVLTGSAIALNFPKILKAIDDFRKQIHDLECGNKRYCDSLKVYINALNGMRHDIVTGNTRNSEVLRSETISTVSLLEEMVRYANNITCNSIGKMNESMKSWMEGLVKESESTITKIDNLSRRLTGALHNYDIQRDFNTRSSHH